MKQLLYSGILYLIGISIVLVFRPSLMFTEDGIWKEFGIGRDPLYYTWLPFWLFAIIWAILSYIIVIVLLGYQDDGCYTIVQHNNHNNHNNESNNGNNGNNNGNKGKKNKSLSSILDMDETKLKPGYYVLNKSSGGKKYTYIGTDAPEILFNNVTEDD
jgi:hypothetical protein